MDNKSKYQNLLIFLAVLVILYLVYHFFLRKENFSPFEESNYISNVSTKYFIDNKDLPLANGMVFKHQCDTGYQYLYKFNLPNPVGSVYTEVAEPLPYTVLAGSDKDNLEVIGALRRSSDGWFYFMLETDKVYNYTKIVTNPGEKVIFEKYI